ncbi:MAG: hypothetical protein ACOYN4_15655 [Bacteroidales bacterium]
MEYIVKQDTPAQVVVNQDRYELFTTEPMQTATGETVDILKSIGIFSIAELQQRKSYLLAEIAELDNKITAITNIQNKQ